MSIHETLKSLLRDASRAGATDGSLPRESVTHDLKRVVRRALRAVSNSPLTRHIRGLAASENIAWGEAELVERICSRLWEELVGNRSPQPTSPRSTVARAFRTERAILA